VDSEKKMELRWGWVTMWRAFFIFLVSRKEEFINRPIKKGIY